MQDKSSKLDFSNQDVYVGLDVHKKVELLISIHEIALITAMRILTELYMY